MATNKSSSHIGSDTIKLTASKIITTLITLVSSMMLSRFRTLTEYGTYSQILMAIQLVCSVIMLGLPNSINYFMARAKTQEEKDKFLSVYYTLNTIMSLVVGLVLVLSVPLLEHIFKNEFIKSFWYFLALFPWTKIIMSSIEHLLIVCDKTKTLMVYRVANSIALLGIIVLVQWCGGTFTTYMILYLATEIVFTLWSYWQITRCATHIHVSLDKSLIKTIFAFSIPIGIASMIGTINIELDKLVITSYCSTEQLAIYTNASKELPVTVISSSLTAVLTPKMVNLINSGKKNEAVSLWNSATTISFAIICFIAAACFVFAPEVITVLYSEKYLDGVGVFRVYCLVLLLRCTYFGMLLNASGKTKFILYSSIGALAFNAILNFAFYYAFGFIGPAIATLVSSLVMNISQLLYSAKICKLKFSQVFPWRNAFILLLFSFGLGGGVWLIHNVVNAWINPIISAILLGIIWLCISILIEFKLIKKHWKILNE